MPNDLDRKSWADHLRIVAAQDRVILDSKVEHEFAVAVLAQLRSSLYLGADGRLRSRRYDQTDQELSVLEAYERYGGEAVEDAYEYGSVNTSALKPR